MASEELMAEADALGVEYQKTIGDAKLQKRIEEAKASKEGTPSPIIVEPKGESQGVEFKVSTPKAGKTKRGSQSILRF